MEHPYDLALQLLAALVIGLLIGIERGWTAREGHEGERIAGIRTFSLIGLTGGVSALFSRDVGHWFIISVFLAVSALVITAHVLDVLEDKDVGTTTAFTMMLTFILAAWSAYGQPIPALTVTVIVISLLGHKPTLHSWLKKVSPRDFFAGVKLLILSVVLLPLLPDMGYGPWEAFNPYWTWLMVVLISGLSFLGYAGIQIIGERKGTVMTAIAGGLASSTAVTFTLARFAKEQKDTIIFSVGVLLASSIMFPRVLIEVFVVHPGLVSLVWIPLTAMLAGLLCCMGWLWRWQAAREPSCSPRIEVSNPLQLGVALQFGFLLAVIMLLSEAMKGWFGNHGVYALSIVSGLMDVDAITLSLAKSSRQDLEPAVAALGIALACATNTLIKAIIFALVAGIRKNILLPVAVLAAILPGLFIAIFLP